MKKQYFLLTLAWLLFAVSGCKDDYRSVVLFEGAEPVYQVGTCDNLVSSLAFFLSETEGETVLGIDGGDGAYSLTNEHESVAAVTFAGDSNGYRRISIQPLAAGETVVRVMDGSGSGAQLRITVKERREYKMSKRDLSMESAAMRPWNCWVRCRKNSPAVPGWKIPDIMC